MKPRRSPYPLSARPLRRAHTPLSASLTRWRMVMGLGKSLQNVLRWGHAVGRPRLSNQRSRQSNYPLGLETLEDRTVPASFSINDVSIIEGDSGTRNALVTVSLYDPGRTGGISVGYTTANGTAASGSDYQAVS